MHLKNIWPIGEAKTKMKRIQMIHFVILLLLTGLMCCQQFFQPQSWSQNYAQLPGTAATHTSMVDGNYETAGQAKQVNQGGSDIIIVLPTRRWISKIYIFSQQLNDPKFKGKKCNLYIKDGDKWDEAKLFPIQGFRTEVRFPALEADQIRIQVPNRLGFRQMSRMVNKHGDVHNQKFYDSIPPMIEEIEIYGPVSTVK